MSSVKATRVLNSDLSPPAMTDAPPTAATLEADDEEDDWTLVFLPLGAVILVLVVAYLIFKRDVCYCKNMWCGA